MHFRAWFPVGLIVLIAILIGLLPIAECQAAEVNLYNSETEIDWSKAPRAPVNFSFADGLTGWYTGHDYPGYRLRHIKHGFMDQKPCISLTAVGPAGKYGECIVQGICAVNYRGKRVRLSGWMKTYDVEGITFGMRLDSRSAITSFSGGTASGTTPWKRYLFVFDVPADAQGFAVAPGNLLNQGKFWLADLRLNVVDKSTPVTPQAEDVGYLGDTERVTHTWMLSRRGRYLEALSEAEWIGDDPAASKEESCTALDVVAFTSLMLGKPKSALKALDQFDADSKGLKLDPGVVAEAARTRLRLNGGSGFSVVPSLGRWQNANGNDWTNMSTTPSNLSFEAGLTGWSKGADNSDAPDYNAGSSHRAYHARPAAFVKAIVSDPSGNAFLLQRLRADHFLGKRVRISGVFRSTGRPETASLFVHLDTRNHYTIWTDPADGLVMRPGWHRCSVVLDVPADGQGISFGGLLRGVGTLWLADMHVDVVGHGVAVTEGGVVR